MVIKGFREKNKAIYYFTTAKKQYDRIIEIPMKSLVNYLFMETENCETNLYLLKAVDFNNDINLLVLTKKAIKRGEVLALDRNLIYN